MKYSTGIYFRYFILVILIPATQSNVFSQGDPFANADASMIQIKQEYALETAQFHPAYRFRAAFSADCKMMAYTNYENEKTKNAFLTILELSTKKVLHKIHITDLPEAIAWSPDGSKIMMSVYNKLNHFDIASGKIVILPLDLGIINALYWKKDNQLYIDGTGFGILNLDDLTMKTPEYSQRAEFDKYEKQNLLDHPRCRIVPGGPFLKVVNLDNSYEHVLQKRDFAFSSVGASANLKYVVLCYFKKIILLELGLREKPETHFSVRLNNYKEMGSNGKKNLEQFPGVISGAKINPLNNMYVGGDGNTKGRARTTGFVNDSVINIEVIQELSDINKKDVFTYNNIWGVLQEAKQVAAVSPETKTAETTTMNTISQPVTQAGLAVADIINGNWSGDIYQNRVKKPYAIRLSVNLQENQYKINYPSFGCSGSWSVEKKSEKSIEFLEHILTGKSCVDGGSVKLVVLNDHQLECNFYKANSETIIAKGTLTKE